MRRALLLGLAASACGDPPRLRGPCEVDADCGALLVCVDGSCEAGPPAEETPASTGASESSTGVDESPTVVMCGVEAVAVDGDRTTELVTFDALEPSPSHR